MAVAALSPSFPGSRDAARRFARALALSAGVHLLLVESLAFDAAQRAAQPIHSGALSVRVEPSAGTTSDAPVTLPAQRLRSGARGAGRNAARVEASVPAHRDREVALALPQAPDPTYYSARDLDVYPSSAEPLELDRLVRGAEGSTAARFRLLLWIDEAGVVNDVSIIDGEPPHLKEALRAALAAIRFQPAQKDGRAVKSRVTLSVSFEPARPESTAR